MLGAWTENSQKMLFLFRVIVFRHYTCVDARSLHQSFFQAVAVIQIPLRVVLNPHQISVRVTLIRHTQLDHNEVEVELGSVLA